MSKTITCSLSNLRTLLHFHFSFFFFNDTATTEIYTLSLHDALPICTSCGPPGARGRRSPSARRGRADGLRRDRKSTRLNSSHVSISYAVFCLKKKKKNRVRYRLARKKLQQKTVDGD